MKGYTQRGAEMCRKKRRGFTLVEILVVIAIIAILAAIIIPTVGVVQRSVARSQTKSQFSAYVQAYQLFQQDRRFYPRMGSASPVFELRDNNDVFIETLAGQKRDGSDISDSYARRANNEGRAYHTFGENEFAREGDFFAGEIVDGFGNPNIVIIVDVDGNGVIPGRDLRGIPAEDRPEQVNASVIIYSDNTENNPDWQWIYSWD